MPQSRGLLPAHRPAPGPGHRAGAGAESDDVETILVVQVVQHKAQGLFGLLDLVSAHRARDVEHQEHVLGDDLVGVHVDLGRSQQQEESLPPAVWLVAEQVDANVLWRDSVVEHEIAVGLDVVLLIADDGIVIAPPDDVHIVAGAVDGLHGSLLRMVTLTIASSSGRGEKFSVLSG